MLSVAPALLVCGELKAPSPPSGRKRCGETDLHDEIKVAVAGHVILLRPLPHLLLHVKIRPSEHTPALMKLRHEHPTKQAPIDPITHREKASIDQAGHKGGFKAGRPAEGAAVAVQEDRHDLIHRKVWCEEGIVPEWERG